MGRQHIAWGSVAFLWATAASADIAPPRAAVTSHRPIPMEHMPLVEFGRGGTWVEGAPKALSDAPLDVSLVSESVKVDVYPTFIRVRNRSTFSVGSAQSSEPVTLGFPTFEYGFTRGGFGLKASAPPNSFTYQRDGGRRIEFLEVRVNDDPVAIREVTRNPKAQEPEPTKVPEEATQPLIGTLSKVEFSDGSSKEPENWRTWEVRFTPNEQTVIDISYAQPTPRSELEHGGSSNANIIHRLWTGGLWKGAMGLAEVEVALHGVRSEDVDSRQFTDAGAEKLNFADGRTTWSYRNGEPVHEALWMLVSVQAQRAQELARELMPYDTSDLPEYLQLLDRIIRWSWAEHDADGWDERLDYLRDAASSDSPAVRDIAAGALVQLWELGNPGLLTHCFETQPPMAVPDDYRPPEISRWIISKHSSSLRDACLEWGMQRVRWGAALAIALPVVLVVFFVRRRRETAAR